MKQGTLKNWPPQNTSSDESEDKKSLFEGVVDVVKNAPSILKTVGKEYAKTAIGLNAYRGWKQYAKSRTAFNRSEDVLAELLESRKSFLEKTADNIDMSGTESYLSSKDDFRSKLAELRELNKSLDKEKYADQRSRIASVLAEYRSHKESVRNDVAERLSDEKRKDALEAGRQTASFGLSAAVLTGFGGAGTIAAGLGSRAGFDGLIRQTKLAMEKGDTGWKNVFIGGVQETFKAAKEGDTTAIARIAGYGISGTMLADAAGLDGAIRESVVKGVSGVLGGAADVITPSAHAASPEDFMPGQHTKQFETSTSGDPIASVPDAEVAQATKGPAPEVAPDAAPSARPENTPFSTDLAGYQDPLESRLDNGYVPESETPESADAAAEISSEDAAQIEQLAKLDDISVEIPKGEGGVMLVKMLRADLAEAYGFELGDDMQVPDDAPDVVKELFKDDLLKTAEKLGFYDPSGMGNDGAESFMFNEKATLSFQEGQLKLVNPDDGDYLLTRPGEDGEVVFEKDDLKARMFDYERNLKVPDVDPVISEGRVVSSEGVLVDSGLSTRDVFEAPAYGSSRYAPGTYYVDGDTGQEFLYADKGGPSGNLYSPEFQSSPASNPSPLEQTSGNTSAQEYIKPNPTQSAIPEQPQTVRQQVIQGAIEGSRDNFNEGINTIRDAGERVIEEGKTLFDRYDVPDRMRGAAEYIQNHTTDRNFVMFDETQLPKEHFGNVEKVINNQTQYLKFTTSDGSRIGLTSFVDPTGRPGFDVFEFPSTYSQQDIAEKGPLKLGEFFDSDPKIGLYSALDTVALRLGR